jgi:hypothetical protein
VKPTAKGFTEPEDCNRNLFIYISCDTWRVTQEENNMGISENRMPMPMGVLYRRRVLK